MLGTVIRRERRRKKMTQKDLARVTGMSRETINRIEREKFAPNVNALLQIAGALEVSASELLKEVDHHAQSELPPLRD